MKNKINNLMNTIINNKFKIITTLYALSIFTYEILFCNAKIFKGEGFTFSLNRLVLYISFLALLVLARKKRLLFNNEKENKFRKILLLIYIPIVLVMIFLIITWGIKQSVEIIALIIITMLLAGVLILEISDNLIKNMIVICFTLGIIFCTTTHLNHRFDERKHFITAFNISLGNLNYKENTLCDEQVLEIDQIQKITKATYNFNKVYKPEICNDIELDHFTTPTDNSFILYIPSAIGIFLARILRGSVLDMYLMGRLFNLFAYISLSIIVLKILPYKKNIFYLVFNLPIILLLSASYSIDAVSLALVSLFVAYCLKLYEQKEKISLKQLILLVSSVFLLIIAKSMAYIAVGIVILILPIFKLIKENKKYIPIFILIMLAIIMILLFSNTNKIQTDTRAVNADSGKQIKYILTNPISVASVLYRHTRDTLFNLTWYTDLNAETFFGNFSNCIFMAIFIFTIIIALNDESKNFKIKDKIIFLLTFFIAFAMTSIALYIGFSEVGGKSIDRISS